MLDPIRLRRPAAAFALVALAGLAVLALGARSQANGAACTITGTSGPDILVGTPGPDVICGRDGDDDIDGAGGDDQLFGEGGNDSLYRQHRQ